MNKPCGALPAATLTLAILLGSTAPLLARGPSSVLNSPGYQRRLEESRKQLTTPAEPAIAKPHSKGRRHRTSH